MQKISETTGPLALALGERSSTGRQRGELVSASLPTAEARAWLAARTPEVVDRALLDWARSSLGVEVSLTTEMRFPAGGAPYSVAVGANLTIPDQDAASKAIMRFQGAMAPPEKTQAEEWFWMLRLATTGAKRSEMDETGTLELYAATLARYPADVAKTACMNLATRPRAETAWFPTLPEVVAECDRLVSPRVAMIGALRSWKPPTEDERRAEAVRDWGLRAANARDEAAMCKRSDPDRHSELMEFVAVADGLAAQLRRREISPDDLPPANTPDKVEL